MAEIVKKAAAKTAAKAKVPAKAKAEGVVAKAPAKAKVLAVSTVAEQVKAVEVTHDEIAHLARRYWEERGWQDGFAEQDWLRAERELRAS